jgi:hypothetical protein
MFSIAAPPTPTFRVDDAYIVLGVVPKQHFNDGTDV